MEDKNKHRETAIQFIPRKRHKQPDEIRINNSTISWANQVKYVAVISDKHLIYTPYIKELITNIAIITNTLYPLNSKSKLSLENKIKLLKAFVVSMATYAKELWHQASENQKNMIQAKLNKIHNQPDTARRTKY
ncbi:hypothetical protein Trydic_g22902 [Trypoxylus dichotomus]